MRTTTLSFLFFFAVLLPTAAQDFTTTDSQPKRDATAVGWVQLAINTMGGASAVGGIQDCVATGYLTPAAGNPQPAGAFKWKNSGSQFRYENPSNNGATSVFVSGSGAPALIQGDGSIKRLRSHMAKAPIAPHLVALVLLRVLNDQQISLASPEAAMVGGRASVRVHVWNGTNEAKRAMSDQVWYFDAATGLPLRLEYKVPENDNLLVTTDTAVDFTDFRSVSGVVVPFQFTFYAAGAAYSSGKLDSVSFNTGISPDQFAAPAGGVQ